MKTQKLNIQEQNNSTLTRTSKWALTLTALAGSAILGTAQAATVTVMADTFDTNSGGIDNRAVETPQAGITDDGDLWSPNDGDGNVAGGYLTLGSTFAKAGAGFDDALMVSTLESGGGTVESFTMTYDWSMDSGTTELGAYFYGGIGDSTTDGRPFEDNSLALGFRINGDFTSTSVTLSSGDGHNPNDFSQALTRADSGTDWAATLAVTYTLASGNAEFFLNGGSIGSITYSGDIGGVWFKSDQMANPNEHRVDNFLLTAEVAVPEPSTLAMILMGMAGLAARRKKILG